MAGDDLEQQHSGVQGNTVVEGSLEGCRMRVNVVLRCDEVPWPSRGQLVLFPTNGGVGIFFSRHHGTLYKHDRATLVAGGMMEPFGDARGPW